MPDGDVVPVPQRSGPRPTGGSIRPVPGCPSSWFAPCTQVEAVLGPELQHGDAPEPASVARE